LLHDAGKQRATISVRGNEILFRSECCRAIIRADRAFLFPSRCGVHMSFKLHAFCNLFL
jgi:hypothetical protein